MTPKNNPLELNLIEMDTETVSSKTIAEPRSLSEWTHVLCNEEMPIFSNTALSVHDVLSDDRKGAMELASVILQDPNLTVKLLKISNTPHYNPSRQKMVTVSRAIIMLGSEVIRELTLVCSFLECILSAINKQQASEEIAQAIHAAVHAKSIAIAANDSLPEEIFIATLLNHIGSISFWCFCGEQGERIQALINKGKCSREEAEIQVLGFKLTELGTCLSKAWKLGGLIEESIKPGVKSKNPRVGLVHLGYEITEALKEGASSAKYNACIRKIEALTKEPQKDIIEKLQNNTANASDMACQFGATDAAMLIQSRLNNAVDLEEPAPDIDKKQLQLHISQDIVSIISDQIDINLLLETVLEGIHRGIGMDRTIFSLLVSDKQSLKEKLSLGWRKDSYENKVVFNVSETPPNIFFHALAGTQAFWAKPLVNTKLYMLRDINVVGKNECFMMPVFSNNIPIGLIYADRGITNQPLTEEDFSAFKYFSQQANIGLTVYRMQRTVNGKID
ncbi:MAG: HDOD domain-containing protein [Methylobacter sp.]|uniref:HDOD domain-containing protein n=1 Tax=Methylobacter sp. TaxID=2051955 RepID=UPI0025EB8AE8|nr:HDOD domain-containing protein [Methylobacter sp.]MCK9619493.1 HDOD domain-containing protein [Methylobacter sp.]